VALFLLTLALLILPFLDGGTSQIGQIILFVLPLPLILFILAKQELKIKLDSLFWLSSLFLILSLISLIFSSSLSLSVPAFFRLLALWILFNLSRVIIKTSQELKMALWAVFLAGIGLSLLSFWYLLPFSLKPFAVLNLTYTQYGHNHLAEYLPFVLLPSLSLFLTSKAKEKLIFGALTGFFFLAMLLTFSRTTFLFFPLVAFLIIRQLTPKKGKILVGTLIFLSILSLVVVSLFTLTAFGKHILSEDPGSFLAKKLIKPLTYEGRINYWREAWRGFLQRPILGWGLGTFRLVAIRFQSFPSSWSWYTHNFYLQTLVELGIFGFLALLAFLYKAFRQAFLAVSKRKDSLLIGVFGGLTLSACQSILDFGWHFPAIALTFLVLLAGLTNKNMPSAEPCFSNKNLPSSPEEPCFSQTQNEKINS